MQHKLDARLCCASGLRSTSIPGSSIGCCAHQARAPPRFQVAALDDTTRPFIQYLIAFWTCSRGAFLGPDNGRHQCFLEASEGRGDEPIKGQHSSFAPTLEFSNQPSVCMRRILVLEAETRKKNDHTRPNQHESSRPGSAPDRPRP